MRREGGEGVVRAFYDGLGNRGGRGGGGRRVDRCRRERRVWGSWRDDRDELGGGGCRYVVVDRSRRWCLSWRRGNVVDESCARRRRRCCWSRCERRRGKHLCARRLADGALPLSRPGLHPKQGISFKSQLKQDLPNQAGGRKQEKNSQTSQPLLLLPRIIHCSVALQRLTSLVPEAHQTNDSRPHAPGGLPGAFVKTR